MKKLIFLILLTACGAQSASTSKYMGQQILIQVSNQPGVLKTAGGELFNTVEVTNVSTGEKYLLLETPPVGSR